MPARVRMGVHLIARARSTAQQWREKPRALNWEVEAVGSILALLYDPGQNTHLLLFRLNSLGQGPTVH